MESNEECDVTAGAQADDAEGAPGTTTRGCPERPSSTSEEELGFVRRPMVRWLDPRQLLDTAGRVVLSGIFGTYSDKRELQALMPSEVYDYSHADELWLDYVADLGDGWHPTYSVASLLASETLDVSLDGHTHATRRGRVLVMGGDQVYPVSKRADYENRMLGPYRAALPCVQGRPPELFAIPGSHDWFDGLANFPSVFCRGYWIGGWKTRQTRTYFALKLPGRWWLWGLDIQFGDYLDEAQLRYFADVAAPNVEEGDRIILCTAKALGTSETNPHVYGERNLAYFEREIIAPTGAHVVVQVASGRHHYVHYRQSDGPRHHIGSGGGGAFLHPTHHLPEHLELVHEGQPHTYELGATYPSMASSKALRKRLWLLPVRNRSFAALLGLVQVLLALMFGLHLDDAHQSLGAHDLWHALWTSPTAVLLILVVAVVLGAMVRFAHDAPGPARILLGLVHSGLQLAAVGGFMMAASRLTSSLALDGTASVLAFLAILGVVGGAGGALGMAAYLWATNKLGFHANEAYAPLRVMDFKHFLRLRVAADGTLTVFPIGIDRVCRRWRLVPDGPLDAPWFLPARDEVETRLIEGPVRIGS